jgi:hypothetical protein
MITEETVSLAGMCGNRTHLPNLGARDYGFEVRGRHQPTDHSRIIG